MSTIQNTNCPKCGSESFETVKHSWRDGVPPHDDYYECWACDHEWTDADIEAAQGEKV
jgi:DNA-directed RNA polymerase subunit M/transcription elongation factor TFIIS